MHSWGRRRKLFAAGLALLAVAVVFGGYPEDELALDGLTSTRIFDRHGELLYERRADGTGGYGRPVALSEVSPHLVQATLSGEDANFRYHPGIDPTGIARAIALNVRCRCLGYGGSSITQQLAKQVDPEPRTFWGKAREAVDAFRLEIGLSKDEILEQYLNRVYYGRLAYGAEAAARRFFGKSASDLTLDEASLLAVLPRAPTRYDPDRHPDAALRRRGHVLAVMAERGWITEAEAQSAQQAPIALVPSGIERRAPHAIDYLERTVFAHHRGLASVHTTIDLRLQELVEERALQHLADLAGRDVDHAGVVVIDNHRGEILAMVGSRSYSDREVQGATNVTMALRPPGSTLKPFVYALAFEDGARPSSPIMDERTNYAGYQPRSSFGRHFGLVSMRDALASSLNAPAVSLTHRLGAGRVHDLLTDLGIERGNEVRGLGLALGGTSVRLVDLANGYATLARGGEHLPWTMLTRTRTAVRRRVISREAALLVTDVLADPAARRRQFGVESPIDSVELTGTRAVAAKTGTSQSFGDNLTVGYTRDVTVATWVGNFDGRPMRSLIAMQGAAPLWADVMRVAMEGKSVSAFERPDSVESEPKAPWRHLPERTLAVESPREAVVLLLDPLIPVEQQTLPLRAATPPGTATVRWEIDGEVVGESVSGRALMWPLERGEHRVRALAIDERGDVRAVTRENRFEVQEEI